MALKVPGNLYLECPRWGPCGRPLLFGLERPFPIDQGEGRKDFGVGAWLTSERGSTKGEITCSWRL